MTTRLLLVALLVSLPTAAAAQSASDATAGVVRPRGASDSIAPTIAQPRRTVLCDDAAIRRARTRRTVGGTIALGVLAGTIVAMEQNAQRGLDDPARGGQVFRRNGVVVGAFFPLFFGALGYAATGLDASFWEQAVANLKIGETRSADVRACLGEPRAVTSSGTEEQWTYAWRHRDLLHAVNLTFEDSVLTGVRRSRVKVSGQHVPAATVPPDILPVLPVHTDSLPPR